MYCILPLQEEGNRTLSEGELTHESLDLEQLEQHRGYGTYGGGEAVHADRDQHPPMYETETLSKRDYYTARRAASNEMLSGGAQTGAAEVPIKGDMVRCEVVMLDGICERFDIDVSV